MAAVPAQPPARRSPTWAWTNVPSWLVSVVFHATLLVTLALVVQRQPRGLGGGSLNAEGLAVFDASGTGGGGDGSSEMLNDEPSGGGGGKTVKLMPVPDAGGGDRSSGHGGGTDGLFDEAP